MRAPNPGSEAAIQQGCKCPVMDNAYGRGAYGGGVKDHKTGETLFWYSESCELHQAEVERLAKERNEQQEG